LHGIRQNDLPENETGVARAVQKWAAFCYAQKERDTCTDLLLRKALVAQSIAACSRGAAQKRVSGGRRYIVSWCVGHLAGWPTRNYDPAYGKWRLHDLPILPERWRFTVSKEKREQYDILRTLLRRRMWPSHQPC
jgi:hypothetical protein